MASFGWSRALAGRALAAAGLLLAFSAGLPVSAQVLPIGPDFQVNTYTTFDQAFPQVTVAPDGDFIVLWCCGEQAGARALVGRRFDGVGEPLGDEFAVSQYSANVPSDVAADSAGNFVVVWGNYVKGRRFTADGTPRGDQFLISPPPGGEYTGGASVAAHADGSFVVTWFDYGVVARRFDTEGAPLGGCFAVPGDTTYARSASVGAQPGGGFVVVWDEYDASPAGTFLRGLRYDADGLPVGGIFEVGAPEWDSWGETLAARADGSFVAGWAPMSQVGRFTVSARILAVDGSPLTPSFVVSSLPTDYNVSPPAIGLEPDGGFLVVWTSLDSPGSDTSGVSIQARRFAPDGTPLGGQFQVNSYTTEGQFRPQVGVQPNGDFVVVWSSEGSSGSDTSYSSVQARRLRPPFFMDGFETGDTSRWSGVQP